MRVRPDALTSCYAQPSHKVVGHRPHGSLPIQRGPEGLDATEEGNANDQEDIQPIHVFVPILLRHLAFCDVFL